MDKIVIVESPSKSKTIGTYLGSGYKVLSSKGHICDLATTGKDGLGIDIENGFLPTYRVMKEKESLVQTLQKECKGKQVFLATDPDREGEAIAYHLARMLGLSLNDLNRIEFNEITKSAVKKALENPHKIDMPMVNSQECRRMIDRILGFKLSKLLQRKIGSKSAGRVQSVALKLIVDLEKEIKSFVPIKYYDAEAVFNTFTLKLFEFKGMTINDKNRILNKEDLINLKSRLLSFIVDRIENKEVNKQALPAYTTSTLQQDAANKLFFSPTKTMRIAQGLYEGKTIGEETVGLITYMRTDSTRLSEDFINAANGYILTNFGKRYLGYTKTKTQKNAQDAHEAIRPTSIDRHPEEVKKYLTDDEYKLYNLIYKRAVSSLMANALYSHTRVEFVNTDSKWYVTGQTLLFDGYLKLYGKGENDDNQILPSFKLNDGYNANEVNILDKETKPKSRYTEASLIKDMEESGIGRPSTYAQTLQTLKERQYIKVEKRSLVPTEQGILTCDKLDEFFSEMINVKYTAEMESALDLIATGTKMELEELHSFYDKFLPLFENANNNMQAIYPIFTDELCPDCGKPLVIRLGKFGEFVACSSYPECHYIKKDEEPEEEKSVDTGIICPKCKKGHLVTRVSSKGKTKGEIFYACSSFPKCKNIYNDEPLNEKCPSCGAIMLRSKDGNIYCSENCDKKLEENDMIKCPKCGEGHLVKRVASKGKSKGNEFYACNKFPKCKNIVTLEEYNKLLTK